MSRLSLVGMRNAAAAMLALLLLSACSMEGPALAGVPGLQWQVQRFYLDRATEAGGMCTAPAIRTITQTTVLAETDDEVVMRIRYSWRDEGMRQDDDFLSLIPSVGCQGFAERDFTMARLPDGSLQVKSMTGELRNVRQNFNTRSSGS